MPDHDAPTQRDPTDSVALDEVVAEYLRAVERGAAPSRDELLTRHPELADELREFFADHDRLANLAKPLRDPALSLTAARTPPDRIRYFGDYELLEEIARGGMGVVYKARQIKLNRLVAVKMILSGQLASPADVVRFHTEAEAAAKLDHPGIVPIYEVGEHEGQHYYSMGFVEGQSLSARVAEGPLSAREAAEIVRAVAAAVHYAHENGVIHRDLKPGNILLDRQGKPRVTDFGLAKLTESGSDLTRTGQVLGTPSYMPPEQAAAKVSAVGAQSDVYSLGAILYGLLTGRPPFQAATPIETLLQVQQQEPVPPRQLNLAIPLDLDTIVLKCLDKSPQRRYASARALEDELNRYLEGSPILARRVGRAERFWRWCRREPVVASLSAAVTAALIAGTSVSAYFAVKERARANEALNMAQRERDAKKHVERLARENELLAEQKIQLAERNAILAKQVEEQTRVALFESEKKRAESERQLRDSDEQLRETQKRLFETEGEARAATRRAHDATAIAYSHGMAGAERAIENGNLSAAGRILDALPETERRWEWHYFRALCRATEEHKSASGFYFLHKDSRDPETARRQFNDDVAKKLPTPLSNSHWLNPVTWRPSEDGRKMPSEELDPTWVNSPPIIPDLINVERPILQMVATGSTLATIAMKDDAYVVEIWNVERGLQKVPVLRTTAPIKRPGRPHTSIGRSKDGQVSTPEEQDPPSGFDVGFAFSHDGRSLAQFWLNPDHAPPSLIYRLSIPEGGEWIAWPPPELTDDGLLVALRRTGANKDLKALLAFFNDNAPDDASRLFVDTPSNRSPDGTRSARFDVNDQRIHIFDNATGKEVCSFASGLNPNEYLERLPADRGVVDYRANGSAIWSSDGKMLIVRLEVACSYQWGHCSVPQAATSEHKLMVPEIHYDCLLFFNPLGQDWLLQEGTEEFR